VTQSFKKTSVAVTGIVVIFFEFQGTSPEVLSKQEKMNQNI
jgi:hypothetical protein